MKMKEFNNNDLKAGMLVELKNGVKGILIPVKDELEVFSDNLDPKTDAYLMTNNLSALFDKNYAIIKVWDLCKTYDLFSIQDRNLLWEYENPKKEMTVEQIEKILGYPIRIVKEK